MPIGAGVRQYEFVEGWPRLPEGWTLGQVAGVAVDSQDHVYVFHRGLHPVIIFDRDGRYLAHWGDEFLQDAHGLYIRRENGQDFIYLVDRARHVVEKCTTDGRVVLRIGTPGQPGAPGQPFNRPTDVAVAPNGDIYVSDGYGNARVHHFAPDGRLMRSWGEPGNGPGQFNLPHSVWVDTRGPEPLIYVADRENLRLQVFTPAGEFVRELPGFRRPTDLYIDPEGYLYIAELRSRVSILGPRDEPVATLGGEESHAPGQFVAPHGVWTDSQGDLYVCEVLAGQRVQKFRRVR
jgi:hypothetical protein